MWRKLLFIAGFALMPVIAHAQITVTYSFSPNTTILSSQVNANFALFSNALNRTGGTMTGTLTSQSIVPGADATYDLGTSGTRFRNGYFSGTATIGGLITASAGISVNPSALANAFVSLNQTSTFLGGIGTRAWFGDGVTGSIALGAGSGLGLYFYTNNSTTAVMSLSTAGILTVPSIGTHVFGSGGTGGDLVQVKNTTAGTANLAGFDLLNDEAVTSAGRLLITSSTYNTAAANPYDPINVASAMELIGPRNGGVIVRSANGPLGFYVGGTAVDWGINTSGDFTGLSSHVVDSVGTPSISSGCGTGPSIAGADYGFKVTAGTTPSTCTINFGHTFSTAPICVVSQNSGSSPALINSVSTTQVAFNNLTGGAIYYLICKGY